MRVAIAHEWLVRYAGSERCVAEMIEAFPGSEVLTTLLETAAVPEIFAGAKPSLLQHIPGATTHHEWLLPLMPAAWRLRPPVVGVDAVISSSHACAKAVRMAPGIPHLCYCHTPMRYAWDFAAESKRFPRPLRLPARAGLAGFRRWDRVSAARVTHFLANSSAVARRIERHYGRSADVLHPPVRTDFFTPGGERGDFFLYVGRLVAYKRPDLAVAAFRNVPYKLLVVGTGALEPGLRKDAPGNVEFLGQVTDERLRELYRGARALLYPADEDFGINMAEAQACGTPVVALAAGGALDIVRDAETGWLMREQTRAELVRLVRVAAETELDGVVVRANGERFAAERFRNGLREHVAEMVESERASPPSGVPG